MNTLEQLKQYTKVVADTGDIESMKAFKPLDATTNPSLILKAAQNSIYMHLIDDAIHYAQKKSNQTDEQLAIALDKVAVNFGLEILKIIPGRVSTEVDSRLSFNTNKTIAKAIEIINLYENEGIHRNKILIKVASTWEGIKAAEKLELQGIHCNLTLLFNITQAIACADAGVQLISPFVGRIYDWHKKDRGVDHIKASEDPGVLSVTNIYNYLKKHNYKTEIMGASFRNKEEIIELAGCDLLTISPKLLAELEAGTIPINIKLSTNHIRNMAISKMQVKEDNFRWLLNEDAMATEKLAQGIRNFSKDLILLEQLMLNKLKS
ncbi:transaldolase [Labilibacter sediminis]|nr:transaldolase [Labilibacter sediminis]